MVSNIDRTRSCLALPSGNGEPASKESSGEEGGTGSPLVA